jgi:hypothetical protein
MMGCDVQHSEMFWNGIFYFVHLQQNDLFVTW